MFFPRTAQHSAKSVGNRSIAASCDGSWAAITLLHDALLCFDWGMFSADDKQAHFLLDWEDDNDKMLRQSSISI